MSSDILAGISCDILFDISCDVPSDISADIFSDISSGILSPEGFWWRSGTAHSACDLPGEVRRCPLQSAAPR